MACFEGDDSGQKLEISDEEADSVDKSQLVETVNV